MNRLKQITLEEAKNYRKLHPGIDYTENDMTRVTCFSREKDPDSRFDMVIYYGDVNMGFIDNEHIRGKVEFVYIFVNPLHPNVVKIGHVHNQTVMQRLKQINAGTGVLTPYECKYHYWCYDSETLEKEIHARLQVMGLRINPRKEGFVINVEEAIHIIEELGKKYR